MSEDLPEYHAGEALVPIEERTVLFYGDEIQGVTVMVAPSQTAVYIPIRPLCGYLGVTWDPQRRRILRDPVLAPEAQTIVVETAGGPQEMTCLPLDLLNGWLFGISAARVREDVRERLIRYQRECYRVLAAAFQGPPAGDALSQVEELGYALITLAREQRQFDRRLSSTETAVEDVTRRVFALEERVAPGEPVTEEQASQISQAVKAVAMAQGKKTGRNEYGGVYGELYRRFGITSYKLLPARRFGEAMEFLSEWWRQVAGVNPPF